LACENRGSSDISIPFVGRTTELARLRGRWERARQEELCLALLAGEAGAGKTRLAEEFGAWVGEKGDRFLRGRAVELQGADPYGPLVEVLGVLLEIRAGLSPEEKQTELEIALRDAGIDSGIFSSFLSEVLLLGQREGHRSRENPELRRHILFEGIARLLQAASRERPICVFLDDMQWASDVVFEVLDYLAEKLDRDRVLFLLAYRNEEVGWGRDGRAHPLGTCERKWVAEREALRLEVGRLSREAVDELTNKLHFGRDWAGDLHRQTDGLALFVAESVKARLQGSDFGGGTLPPRAQQIIDYRLDRLVPEDRTTLRCAALLGEQFDGMLLAGTLGETPAHVLYRLERLREGHRLLTAGEGTAYRFTHARIREKLIDELTPYLRQSYFLAAGESLEKRGKIEAAILPDLAYWFGEGGDWERAARYTVRVAALALERTEREEAKSRADEAVELLERSGSKEKGLLSEVYWAAAEVLHGVGNWGRTTETFSRTVACCEKALEVCEDSLQRADLNCWLADFHANLPGRRRELLEAAEREIGDRTTTVQFARLLYRQALKDDIRFRVPLLEKCARLFERHAPDDPELFPLYRQLVLDLAFLEESDRLERYMSCFQKWVKVNGDVVLALEQYSTMASIFRNLGEYHREAEMREHLLESAEKIRHVPTLVGQHTEMAWTCSILGEFERAAENFGRAIELHRQQGTWMHFGILVIAAHFASLEGRDDFALERLEEALQTTYVPAPQPEDEGLQKYHESLGYIERIFGRMGQPARFRAFCRTMRLKESERGVRVERVWWSEPGRPDEEGWRQTEEAGFAGTDWQWVDPHGVCRYSVDDGVLTIHVTEILGFNELTFPRLVRELGGDFAVEVEVKSAEEMEAAQRERLARLREGRLDRQLPFPAGVGLLVCDEKGNGVRLGAHVQAPGDVLFDGRMDGERPVYGRAWSDGGAIVLRLERRGNGFRAFCRSAGGGWLCCGEVEAPVGYQVQVGLCAEIPFMFSHLVRWAEGCFVEVRLFRPVADDEGAFERELGVLRALREVACGSEEEAFEGMALRVLIQVAEAEWGQFAEMDGSGEWRVLSERGKVAGGERVDWSGMGSDEKTVTLDPEGTALFLSLREGERRGALALGRERPFESEERELLAQTVQVVGALMEKRGLEEELEARRLTPLYIDDGMRRFPHIIGKSAAIQEVLRQVERIGRSAASVLIQGESGTGKELIARAIHDGGPRKDRPFVAQNCAALPESLLESELFGYQKGAFTGAEADKLGLFEVADGGTIFLDEIADASLVVQAKFLRAVEEGEIRRVGDTQSRKVDVRIASATSRDLVEEVERGRLREDLYYRLNVVRVVLPPLRERREDIPLLAEHFLGMICTREGKGVGGITEGAMDTLCAYPWPGNVRELHNEVERCVTLVGKGKSIDVEDLSSAIRNIGTAARDAKGQSSLRQRVVHLERTAIQETLQQCDGNVSQVARELGLSRSGLRRKIGQYGLGSKGGHP
jgi:DNA-binding NtrC family response regulator/tetratricopeptide (TPR) repeat protein